MRHQEFIIGNNIIVASNKQNASSESIFLSNVSGWDTPPEVRRNVVEKLFSSGDHFSKYSTFASKFFSVTIWANFKKETDIRIVRNKAIQMAAKINELFDCQMVYYENNIEVFREKLQCLPDSPFFDEWAPFENYAETTLNFYAPNPMKTVWENGSLSPELEKRL